ncbi:MAG: anthranilate synthase component I family protein, partial [Verrucomicrobiota bacterium]
MALAPPERLSLNLSPEALAAELAHLPGFVVLDSASSSSRTTPDGSDYGPISLISALPTSVIRGHLSHPEALRDLLAEDRDEAYPDWGVPVGGAIGMVDFNGDYLFGQYPHLLIYHHDRDEWMQTGASTLLDRRRPGQNASSSRPTISFRSGMSREGFVERVEKALEWIAAGDIYQVNLSQQFSAPSQGEDPFQTYLSLRDASPSPYGAYLNLGGRVVLSSSPECFLRMSGRGILTRPIKGTRPRFPGNRLQDERSAYDLITSPKEVAELVMITDLERNDLGQLCQYGSVHVKELLKLERFEQVFHLVSTVEGTLRDEWDHVEALVRCSPGGSISGAPKKRALEIIEALEPVPRGLYTGSIGYLGSNEESQMSIAIRTLVLEEGHWHFHVGAGIVADSNPEFEYEETLHKAR